MVPPELADPSHTFGLLRRTIPRRIGKDAGPKARILVGSPAAWWQGTATGSGEHVCFGTFKPKA